MQKERPLSPHLQVYDMLQITSLLSFAHRSTGVFLAMAMPVLVYWLWAIAEGPATYAVMQDCLSHWIAQLALLGWTFSLFYHLCNGIRHLFWDIGHGYELKTLYASGRIVVLSAIVLTAITVFLVFSQAGGGI